MENVTPPCNDDEDESARYARAVALVEDIWPMLAANDGAVIGIVIATLLANYLAGFEPNQRVKEAAELMVLAAGYDDDEDGGATQ